MKAWYESALVAVLGGAIGVAALAAIFFLVAGLWIGPIALGLAAIAFVVAVPIAAAHALLLGLPLYLLLRGRLPLTRGWAAAFGFMIGAVPMTLRLYSLFGLPRDLLFAEPWSLARDGGAGLACGVAGAVGGLFFRTLLLWLETGGSDAVREAL
ncbi:hypothetical protein [Sphingomonas sp.]|jgi:hypothetical protein|uniref:hypothetical protein n=1 Tax=Sphingomonas sp. TaxID=28214 RepID=UPI002ED81797